jgi:toxin ParE1/3/4
VAARLIWSPAAIGDIEEIAEYISRDSPFYAESVVSKIFESTQKLSNHPKIGRVVPETHDLLIREIFVYQYRLIYEIVGKDIHFLALIHGRHLLNPEEI